MKYILTSKPSILAFLQVERVGVSKWLRLTRTKSGSDWIAMTRVTNFGLKRTYLEAGFSNDGTASKETALIVPGEQSSTGIYDPTASSEAAPPKKKRKRTPKSKRDGNLTKNAAEGKSEAGKNGSEDVTVESGTTVPATGKSGKRNKKNKERRKGKSFAKLS